MKRNSFAYTLCSIVFIMIFSIESIASAVNTPSHIVSVPMVHETFSNSENVFELEVSNNAENYLSYKTDFHGTVYGPEDYTLENGIAYILNSSNNTISVYEEGAINKNITLHDFIATNIAVADGIIYSIGTNMKVYRIDEFTAFPIIDMAALNTTDDISDFKIIENTLLITTPEGDSCKTYIYDLTNLNTGNKITPTIVNGRMIENGIYYYVIPLTEGDQLISNTCKLIIHYPDSTKEEIIIKSEYGLVGVELLAIKDDVFCALISEVLSDNNYKIIFEKSLQIITKQGMKKFSYPLPNQVKSIDNPVKVINGHIYFLHNDISQMKLEILDEKLKTEKMHTSVLDSIIPLEDTIEYSIETTDTVNTLTGDEMIEIAESYRREFEWSCSNQNLTSLYDWECPSYVTSAGSYTNMPYCWNGYDTQESYEQGLLSTINGVRGHVGNTNRSYPNQVYGLDCSGYVSRCWELSYKRNTSMFDPDNNQNYGLTEYINITQIRTGDALNSPGDHIMLVESLNLTTGSLLVFECTTSSDYDKVVYVSHNWNSISNRYDPIRYVQ